VRSEFQTRIYCKHENVVNSAIRISNAHYFKHENAANSSARKISPTIFFETLKPKRSVYRELQSIQCICDGVESLDLDINILDALFDAGRSHWDKHVPFHSAQPYVWTVKTLAVRNSKNARFHAAQDPVPDFAHARLCRHLGCFRRSGVLRIAWLQSKMCLICKHMYSKHCSRQSQTAIENASIKIYRRYLESIVLS
jgi:hypothetical protein